MCYWFWSFLFHVTWTFKSKDYLSIFHIFRGITIADNIEKGDGPSWSNLREKQGDDREHGETTKDKLGIPIQKRK